ncbi:MAG TPA: HAD family hydrolase [Longimicrobium sp.]
MLAPAAMRAAVFLDRDGTLIEDRHYLSDPAGVVLLPSAAEAVRRLNERGWLAVLVTNQSGIGRGMFGEDDYAAVHRRLVELLATKGARLDAEYHCPLAPGDPDPHHMRKPGAGMYRRAAAEHGIDLARSWLVGDRVRDAIPARELGASALLVHSPQTEVEEAGRLGIPIVPSLAEAVGRIGHP